MFRSTVGTATRMNIASRRRTRSLARSAHSRKPRSETTYLRKTSQIQRRRRSAERTNTCSLHGGGVETRLVMVRPPLQQTDRQLTGPKMTLKRRRAEPSRRPSLARLLACLPLNQLDHRHDQPHVNHDVTAHRPLPRRDINQSCIFRVVQVIKSLHWRRGIIYRGPMIMSANGAWNRNVFKR